METTTMQIDIADKPCSLQFMLRGSLQPSK